MFIERNTFHLKFGAGKDALRLWSDYLRTACGADTNLRVRLFTDLTGDAYVLVLELNYETYAELEPSLCRLTQQPGWKAFYEQFIPLCERSERVLLKAVFP
ncbi:MAG: hypothetical protein IPN76_07070 [Saprospiraceae bacterium]|nr:hypothetical protein [Saprospiraceae bacterium]